MFFNLRGYSRTSLLLSFKNRHGIRRVKVYIDIQVEIMVDNVSVSTEQNFPISLYFILVIEWNCHIVLLLVSKTQHLDL